MATELSLDIERMPELRRVAEEVRDSRRPVVLRAEDEEIAVLVPLPRAKGRGLRRPTQAEIEASMSAAGAWQGQIDVDEFKEQVRAGRSSRRPAVDL